MTSFTLSASFFHSYFFIYWLSWVISSYLFACGTQEKLLSLITLLVFHLLTPCYFPHDLWPWKAERKNEGLVLSCSINSQMMQCFLFLLLLLFFWTGVRGSWCGFESSIQLKHYSSGFFSLYTSTTHTIQLLDSMPLDTDVKRCLYTLAKDVVCTQKLDLRSFKLPPPDWTAWISFATGLLFNPLTHPKRTEYVMKSHPFCTYLDLVFHILYVISMYFIQCFTFEQHE